MNIKEQLAVTHSRDNANLVINYIGNDEQKFAELMDLFLYGEYRTVQRASQPISIIVEKNADLISPYLADIIKNLKRNPIPAVKRNTMRFFQFIDIDESITGELFDIALSYLIAIDEPVAVKAFSMTVLRKICTEYPELIREVRFQIEILVQEKVSAGLTHRGEHELIKLKKIEDDFLKRT
ncbi:hypothetical protein [Crocinitomix catalasitica]|uniref:hypothetical protein n=1 Tax=Crocinitomix catalasitica TaxID=184607 RepID=UPI00048594A7|nr:hypothetical protein [Crocinitomix catalasitica]